MQFVTTDQRIAVENFQIGLIYTVTFTGGRYFSGACIGKGADFVMFQRTAPELVYCLNMAAAADVESIEQTGGGGGTLNYNDLYNKPQINGVELAGNKSSSDLGLAAQSDLTPLQAAIAELVDGGAKNICNTSLESQTLNKINFTVNSDGTILADSDDSATTALVSATVCTLTGISGTYVLSGCALGGTDNTYRLDIVDDTGGSPTVVGIDTGNSVQVMLDSTRTYRIRIRVTSGQIISNLLFKPMLCTKADWGISQAYTPYTPTLYELYQMLQG